MRRVLLMLALRCALPLATMLGGCSSTQSMGTPAQGNPAQMFQISSEVADRLVGAALMEEFPNVPLTRVDLPYKGYLAVHRFALDSQTFTAYMIPAKGIAPSGEHVAGYYFEVTSSGTMPLSGQTFTRNIYDRLIRNATAIAQPLPSAR